MLCPLSVTIFEMMVQLSNSRIKDFKAVDLVVLREDSTWGGWNYEEAFEVKLDLLAEAVLETGWLMVKDIDT